MQYLLIAIVYAVLIATLGTHCVDYAIFAITGQDITWVADLVLAGFFGSFFIPASALLWVAGLLGVAYPLIS